MISNSVLSRMIEWFAANKLVIHLEKTNIMKFVMSNSPHCALTIGYKDKYIEETVNSKFLDLHWKDHIDQMIPKLGGACYTATLMFHISNINTLKSMYCAYFHSYKVWNNFLGKFFQQQEDTYFTK
jgi:hypothetical protein